MISVSKLTKSCMVSLTTWALFKVLISSGSVMPFRWKKMFQWNEFLIRELATVCRKNFFQRLVKETFEGRIYRNKYWDRLKSRSKIMLKNKNIFRDYQTKLKFSFLFENLWFLDHFCTTFHIAYPSLVYLKFGASKNSGAEKNRSIGWICDES